MMANDRESRSPACPAFSLEDFDSGKIAPNSRWLKEISGKWPGDETIEELPAALDNNDEGDLRGDLEWRKVLTR
jgi:hypothetical protein